MLSECLRDDLAKRLDVIPGTDLARKVGLDDCLHGGVKRRRKRNDVTTQFEPNVAGCRRGTNGQRPVDNMRQQHLHRTTQHLALFQVPVQEREPELKLTGCVVDEADPHFEVQ